MSGGWANNENTCGCGAYKSKQRGGIGPMSGCITSRGGRGKYENTTGRCGQMRKGLSKCLGIVKNG